MRQIPAGALLTAACLLVVPGTLHAQLISPGRLAAAHSELEGIRNCTSCHQLGKSGVSAERCLSCHEEIQVRVREDRGYHATVAGEDCATCHQDHLGQEFTLVRFEEGAFDHTLVGFALELTHGELDCRSCHEPSQVRDPVTVARKTQPGALARTFLGLPADCAGCHLDESPHGTQFGAQGCVECHDSGHWEEPNAFDHSVTAFALDGRHVVVTCAECHGTGETARYTPLAFAACSDCHTDPHRGAMHGACARCHGTDGWHDVGEGVLGEGFDHSATRFALRGGHATADCAACHRTGPAPVGELVRMAYRAGTAGRAYPLPVAETCASCHVDRHAGTASARRWRGCSDCHTETAWHPSSFGLAGHAGSGFALSGAHVTTPCVACHQVPELGHERFQLAIGGQRCVDCHAAADPHEGLYGGLACETCHETEAFDEVTYDHAERLEPSAGCAGCHAPDDPHAGQFEGRDCSTCHVTESYTVTAFDHSATRFPLDGAHDGAECASCHVPDPSGATASVWYRPLGTECADCHGEIDEA